MDITPNADTNVPQCGACRQSGRAILQDMILRLRRRADNLETISKMLPAEPTREQDEALWNVLLNVER